MYYSPLKSKHYIAALINLGRKLLVVLLDNRWFIRIWIGLMEKL
jgi:hypothetical protein